MDEHNIELLMPTTTHKRWYSAHLRIKTADAPVINYEVPD